MSTVPEKMERGTDLFELGSEERLDVRLFLEDEAREESDDLFWFVLCKYIFENEFGEVV